MIPLFFGPAERAKYGVFHPAAGHGTKGRGVVFCDALFDEAIRAHRALRFASESMAAARWNSFRFDYFGTGDSAGETQEFNLVQACQDIHEAIQEIRSMASLSGVYLLGLRLGGALAMQCAAERDDIRGVILWDPVVDGSSVLVEFDELAEPDTSGRHLGGYVFRDELRDQLQSFTIRDTFSQFNGPILMICTAATDTHHKLAQEFPNIDLRIVEAPEAWLRDPAGGVKPIPAAVIRQIEAWQG